MLNSIAILGRPNVGKSSLFNKLTKSRNAIVSDFSTIQFRMLNKSKGPAMWSPRAQCDRKLFEQKWRALLEKNKNFYFGIFIKSFFRRQYHLIL